LESYPGLGLSDRGGSYDRASSTTALYALLKLGGKVSVLPSLAAHAESLAGFQFRELHNPKISREICLITRQLRSMSPNTQRILDTLMSTLKAADHLYGAALFDCCAPGIRSSRRECRT